MRKFSLMLSSRLGAEDKDLNQMHLRLIRLTKAHDVSNLAQTLEASSSKAGSFSVSIIWYSQRFCDQAASSLIMAETASIASEEGNVKLQHISLIAWLRDSSLS